MDGGNSRFSDSARRAADLERDGIGFLDAGTSGGIWGPKYGYCLMVGGRARALPDGRVRRFGPSRRPTATRTSDRRGRATSSRWCTTRSSTRCSRPTARGSSCSPRPATTSICRAWPASGPPVPSCGRGCSICSCWRSRPTRSSTRSRDTSRTPAKGRWTLHEAIERAVPDAGSRRRALRAVRLAAGGVLLGEGHRGAAQPVRRSRHAASDTRAAAGSGPARGRPGSDPRRGSDPSCPWRETEKRIAAPRHEVRRRNPTSRDARHLRRLRRSDAPAARAGDRAPVPRRRDLSPTSPSSASRGLPTPTRSSAAT